VAQTLAHTTGIERRKSASFFPANADIAENSGTNAKLTIRQLF
jgi:hypothetical protein